MKALLTILFVVFTLSTIYPQDTINVPEDYATIQAAIDASVSGDIVLVVDDTYYENINFKGKAITVASHFFIDGDTSHISNTIINGSQPAHPDSGSVAYFVSGEDTTSVLCGFTITGGTGTGYYLSRSGGGIYIYNAGGKICHNKIIGNGQTGTGVRSGGGICSDAQSTLYSIIIESNIIINNSAAGGRGYAWGGGICISNINGVIQNNIIRNNEISGWGAIGGGIYIDGCSPLLVNNTIVDNEASSGGGHPESVGGIAVNNGTPIILNSIIWGNINHGGDPSSIEGDSAGVFYCDVEEGYVGVGNIDVYPEFVDTANGDYRLANDSPCISSAIDSIEIAGIWYYSPPTDMEGRPRPNPAGTMPDMGAFENGPVVGVEDELNLPVTYKLHQNYPNPFNPLTTIKYQIPELSFIILKVYDVLGNEVATLVNSERSTGNYEIEYNASDLSSGIYFYRLQAGSFIETKKMILLK
jgi:hypothetical protein